MANLKQGQQDSAEQPEEKPKSLLFKLWEHASKEKQDSPVQGVQPEKSEATPPPSAPVSPLDGRENQMDPKDICLEAMRKNVPLSMLKNGGHGRYSDFMLERKVPSKEQKAFFKELEGVARTRLELREQEEARLKTSPSEEGQPVQPPSPIAAQAFWRVSSDRMEAWAFVFPPIFCEDLLQDAVVQGQLQALGIKHGVDAAAVQKLLSEQGYLQLTVVARGTPPIDGKDGTVEELFPRENKMELQESSDGTVDYKNLNWLHSIHTGEVICRILPPVPAVDGMRVNGELFKARQGREAIVPKGINTVINEDGTALVAAVDGQVVFGEGRFRIDQILTIRGDVDNSTGNLEAIGDIIVQGNVFNGFTVKATGNVTIQGMAEGAWIIAGGGIQIGMGMNGSGRGVLDAGGDVKCKYLENCTVNAQGSVFSDSIINCNVYSNDRVQITTGHGVIIGGAITAVNEIACRVVGNKSNRSTVLVLGSTPALLKEKSELQEQLKHLDAELEETFKNVQYLQASSAPLPPQQQSLLNNLKIKIPVQKMQKSKIERRLRQINRLYSDVAGCRITCSTVYPPAQLTIGSVTEIIQEIKNNCCFYVSKGEIVSGSKF